MPKCLKGKELASHLNFFLDCSSSSLDFPKKKSHFYINWFLNPTVVKKDNDKSWSIRKILSSAYCKIKNPIYTLNFNLNNTYGLFATWFTNGYIMHRSHLLKHMPQFLKFVLAEAVCVRHHPLVNSLRFCAKV